MNKTTQSSRAGLSQVQKLAGQLLKGEGRAVVRNLEFYRKAERHLLANHNPYGWGGMRLSPSPTKR
jgi:hypothetical protein